MADSSTIILSTWSPEIRGIAPGSPIFAMRLVGMFQDIQKEIVEQGLFQLEEAEQDGRKGYRLTLEIVKPPEQPGV